MVAAAEDSKEVAAAAADGGSLDSNGPTVAAVRVRRDERASSFYHIRSPCWSFDANAVDEAAPFWA